jgi:hypothetical protein
MAPPIDMPPPLYIADPPAIIRPSDREVARYSGRYDASIIAAAMARRRAIDRSLFGLIKSAGLTAGLHICLDAGAAASYPGTGQTWADLSGNGTDFFLGADGSVTATDPTFNGTAGGLSSAEYFSFDGGDYFRKASGNTTEINDLHKNNAAGTIISIIRTPASLGTNVGLWGTNATGLNVGIQHFINGGPVRFAVLSGGVDRDKSTGASLSVNTDYMLAVSWDETDTGFFWANGSYLQSGGIDEWPASYAGPTASDATYTAEVGAIGNGSAPAVNGTRFYAHALLSGVKLSKADLDALYALWQQHRPFA